LVSSHWSLDAVTHFSFSVIEKMHKITVIFFLFPSLLYSQINADYKEIAKQKIKAVYIGDTTLEDYEVFLYDSDGYFREKQIYNNYTLSESMKFERDGVSWEELEMCCKEYTRNPFRCSKADTCSYRKIKYNDNLRLISYIGMDSHEDWNGKKEAFEKESYICNEYENLNICFLERQATGFQYLDNYTEADKEDLRKIYYSIIKLDTFGNELSCQSFLIYDGDTTNSDYSLDFEPGNRLKFYSETGVLLAKEYFYFSDSGNKNKNCNREEYKYKKNGELKKIVFYSKEIVAESCKFICDSLWYLNANAFYYRDIDNGNWKYNYKVICFPKYKKLKTVIPKYDDWIKGQRKAHLFSMYGMYSPPLLKFAFKIDYWE